MTDEQLVDSLRAIKSETVGLDALAYTQAFLAEDKPPKFAGGVLGTKAPTIYPQMRLLVQHGVAALPVLLRHLDDARPTHLALPKEIVMWSQMAEEYDPRNGKRTGWDASPGSALPYKVKVGDVCFALVGQIVGRELLPIRYQPTGGMIINSPVEKPELAKKVRADWTGLTADDFRLQLLKDAKAGQLATNPCPLARLRYYFPEEYARKKQDGQDGDLKRRIARFEEEEKNN